MLDMKRREFITLLGGVTAWPFAARAQQGGRVRRIGVLAGGVENDPMLLSFVAAFRGELRRLGWTDRVTFRSSPASPRATRSACALMRPNLLP
jgi:hypothetical protein